MVEGEDSFLPGITVHEHGHPDHVSPGCDDFCPGLETGSSEEAEIASLPWPHWRATTASPVWGYPRHLQELSPCSSSGV